MVSLLKGDGIAIMSFFIGAIITVVFLSSIANQVYTSTNTFNGINVTFNSPAVNQTVTIHGRELFGTPAIINGTSEGIATGNFTVSTLYVRGVGTIIINNTNGLASYSTNPFNITYEYAESGYINQSGGRTIATLIVIFGALAILIGGIVILIKTGSLGDLLKR